MFHWENAVALDTVQGNLASSRREGKVSWVFSSCGTNLGYNLELWWGCPFETEVCSVKSGQLSRYEGQLRNVNSAWQDNSDASGSKWEFRSLFLFDIDPDTEQWTGYKLGKEYIKAVYCHPVYLTSMQSTSHEMLGWMKHKLESRLPGEISTTSEIQIIPH